MVLYLLRTNDGEIEGEFYEQEQCPATVASISPDAAPYQQVEEIHHNTWWEDEHVPSDWMSEPHVTYKNESDKRQHALDCQTDAGADRRPPIDHLGLGFDLAACVWHHGDNLRCHHFREWVAGENGK